MKKLLFLSIFAIFCSGSVLQAQYAMLSDQPADELLRQNPIAKASLLAAADDSIEARKHENSNKVYYVRRVTCPWSGESSYQLVVFDPVREAFVEREDYAGWNNKPEVILNAHTPDEVQQDSCTTESNVLPQAIPNKAKPRRSSTVKLLAHKF